MQFNKFLIFCLSGLLATVKVQAASFQLIEQSAYHLGSGCAGTAAEANDASAAYFNSSALMFSKSDKMWAISGIGIFPQSYLSLNSSQANRNLPNSQPLAISKIRLKGNAFIPQIHYTQRINEQFGFSLSLNSPFGLKTIYPSDSSARYMATRSELITFNVSPSLAYKFNEWAAIGFGLDVLYAKAQLDVNTGFNIPDTDGYQKNQTDGVGLGGHFSYFINIKDTRLGFNYRSPIRLKTQGKSESLSPRPVSNYTTQGLKETITLPESVTFSVSQVLDEKWTVLGDFQWTQWSRFKDLILKYGNGTESITHENYKNTCRLAFGSLYQYNSNWIFKGGVAFDKSPAQNATRTARIPDSDRTWVSMGLHYTISSNLSLSLGIAHLFFKPVNIVEKSPVNPDGSPYGDSKARLSGRIRSNATILGLQLNYKF